MAFAMISLVYPVFLRVRLSSLAHSRSVILLSTLLTGVLPVVLASAVLRINECEVLVILNLTAFAASPALSAWLRIVCHRVPNYTT